MGRTFYVKSLKETTMKSIDKLDCKSVKLRWKKQMKLEEKNRKIFNIRYTQRLYFYYRQSFYKSIR